MADAAARGRELAVLNIAAEILRCAKLTGSFTLRSGAASSVYFDKYRFESDPQLLAAIAAAMVPHIPSDADVLAGLEMGGIPVVTALSAASQLPAAFVRKAAKSYGTCKIAEGPALEGRNVVLVEDVVSSGGAILDAAAALRAEGVSPSVALCVIDRQTGGRERLESAGIELRPLLTMAEIEAAT